MSEPRLPAAALGSRPPVVVILCSTGVALVGLVVSILWLVVMSSNLGTVFVGPLLAVNLYDVIWRIHGGSYSIFVAGASLVASIEYWRRRRRGIYLHILATFMLVPALSLALEGAVVLVVSLVILATMAAYLRAKPALIITAVSLALTSASYFYQQMGPEIGKYGTECVPIEDCSGPLLGAGYPLQYVVNTPGITDPTSLGAEDKLRLVPFALDTLLYIAITYSSYILIRYYRARGMSPEGEG